MMTADSPISEPDDVCIDRRISMEATDGKNLSFMMKLMRCGMGKECKYRNIHFNAVLISQPLYHLVPRRIIRIEEFQHQTINTRKEISDFLHAFRNVNQRR